MFIVSKRNYQVRRADGSFYLIKRDFVGDIPDDVAASNLVQRGIRGGMILVPEGSRDKQMEQAGLEAAKKAAAHDIRPDAQMEAEKEAREAGAEKDEQTTKAKGAGKKG